MEDIKKHLTALMPDILRFAKIQLRDDSLAEDLVQDTLAAAIGKSEQFRAEAGLKTWVIGILKNKITDHFRSRKPTVSIEYLQEENAGIDAAFDGCFDGSGHWSAEAGPQEWRAVPEEAAHQQDFFRALENCMQGLPEDTARIFYLREVMGWDTDEICRDFGISPDNCYVILHRARNGLRQCLQHRWFDLGKPV